MLDGQIYSKPMMLVPNRIDRRYPGGREIDRFRGLPDPKDDTCPEAWVGSTTYTYQHQLDPSSKQGLAEVYTDDGKCYLKDVIERDPVNFLGQEHVERFGSETGLLVKLLDAQKQLGLQTHPDRAFAKKYFNSDYGKAESWYVIGTRDDQDEPPYVLLGFKEGITRERFEKLFIEGNVAEMERCCHKIPVNVGDMFFVDAGVPHAIGPGCFVIEVQEPSDITVGARMQHFDDPEEEKLFIERTMGCYHYIGRSYEDNLKAYKVEPKILCQAEGGIEKLLLGKEQTPFFSITRVDVTGKMQARDSGTFSIVIVLDGKGALLYDGGSCSIKKGDEIFLPAGLKDFYWEAKSGVLSAVRSYPPQTL